MDCPAIAAGTTIFDRNQAVFDPVHEKRGEIFCHELSSKSGCSALVVSAPSNRQSIGMVNCRTNSARNFSIRFVNGSALEIQQIPNSKLTKRLIFRIKNEWITGIGIPGKTQVCPEELPVSIRYLTQRRRDLFSSGGTLRKWRCLRARA